MSRVRPKGGSPHSLRKFLKEHQEHNLQAIKIPSRGNKILMIMLCHTCREAIDYDYILPFVSLGEEPEPEPESKWVKFKRYLANLSLSLRGI